MKRYNPKDIEPKWQKTWEDSKIYQASEDPAKPKKYVLEYFPYPSGAAMHVGHVRNYTIGDSIARFNRMQGFNVLHPMGWDAFGLPAENYAIKTGTSPRKAVDENTKKFKQQLMQMGFSYDWSREIDSTDPNYYRWTQWFFLLLHKRGLAYQKESLQWWCPVDKTVLANEQVENGRCWRCDNLVEKKPLKQWFFKITDYADRLIEDLDELNWTDAIKSMQRNWIGKSVGAEIDFIVEQPRVQEESAYVPELTVFTTRADTICGVTFLAVAPEHKWALNLATPEKYKEVDEYIDRSVRKSDIERMETEREKTGVFTGSYAINPLTKEKIEIWIADYVLGRYGTGAIMAVPAHDERDFEFAKKFKLPIRAVVKPAAYAKAGFVKAGEEPSVREVTQEFEEMLVQLQSGELVYSGEGYLINSSQYNKLSSSAAREAIVRDITKKDVGCERTNYRLSDWLISRQRYWGAPIPIIHCPTDGAVPVPEADLPVKLPELEKFEPSDDGRSPLANVPEFVNTTCPKCGGKAERETDTMDGFACSSWYFLRFADPHNNDAAFDPEKAKFWLPVDDYIGGAEHAVMHLLYARFWTKVMFDEGLINFEEPFKTLRNQGMILAPDGLKMSKSKGNTIEPGGLIEQGYGADATRIMELFIGPYNQMAAWSVEGMGGSFRFLQRVWTLTHEYIDSGKTQEGPLTNVAVHKTIKKVTSDLTELGFNTAIAALMECVNDLYKQKAKDNFDANDWGTALNALLQLLAPFAPHITEELWHDLGHKASIHTSEWPAWDDKYLVSDSLTIAVQVNGKLRATIQVASDSDEQTIIDAAKADANVSEFIGTGAIKREIYVPKKLVNLVV